MQISIHFEFLFLLLISFIIKIEEEEHHEHRLHECEEQQHFGIITIGEEWNAKVDNKERELGQLQLCDVLLPPHGLSELRLVGGEEVVEIHYSMDNAIHVS